MIAARQGGYWMADKDKKSGDHTHPLHEAVLRGDLEVIAKLIAAGANIDAKDSPYSALRGALRRDDREAAKELIAAGMGKASDDPEVAAVVESILPRPIPQALRATYGDLRALLRVPGPSLPVRIIRRLRAAVLRKA